MIRRFILLATIIGLFSCSNKTKNEPEIKDGYHRAYVEIFNTKTGIVTDSAADVFLKDDLVIKICFSNCISNFDFWEHYFTYQTVYSKNDDPRVYTVYIIPDESDEAEKRKEDEEERNQNTDQYD